MSDFKSLNLLPSIFKAVSSKGYTTPTPIQAQAIPHLLEGSDLLGIAQTGTGKTAAFSLPIIHRIGSIKIKTKPGRVRVLILTPTRELASQIDENIRSYSVGLNIKSSVIFGGVGKRPQVQAIAKGIDIMVATPGRLLDLMNEGHVRYDQLEVFVLDEADRMLDMGFIRDIKKIISKLPKRRQTLLFSATMPDSIASLATSLLNNPKRVEVTPQATTVEKIDQRVNLVDKSNKNHLLKSILEDESIKSVLVFTRTKHGANRVVKHLDKASITAAAIHGNKSQSARERALGSFRSGNLRVLVATDIASRGIDVDHVTHVINFDLPVDAESYVHRIGRTARAGREGVAISFCDDSELKLLRSIEKFIKIRVPVDKEHAFHGVAPSPKEKHLDARPQTRDTKKPGNSQKKPFRGPRRRKTMTKKPAASN
ncbi:DEAD/DEAH box helicase [Halobacteriovorax marinus]|uniref:DEAD-box ATP-dependent RNA helicase RhpA n=1 Tax=Halobacteriovorax marinus TaxID=97084 RepID=A0A1Y5F856_9BACT|nr:DEAD/DEAH box helicase [Halobacteriovorax marinus]